MSDSPYAPPQADPDASPYAPPRADLEKVNTEPLERPWQVSRAVTLLWVSFGIGVANSLVNMVRQAGSAPMVLVFGLIGLLVGGLIAYWIYNAIAKGRNWARILYLVLTPFWLLTLPLLLFQLNRGLINGLQVLISFANFGVAAYVFYLLLTGAAREWFREMKER